MTDLPLRTINAATPVGYLASLGLSRLAPPATLSFAGTTPVLNTDTDLHALAEGIATALERTTHPDTFPLPDTPALRTTTPAWSDLAPYCCRSWDDRDTDQVLHTFDVGASKDTPAKTGPDPQVPAASLILVSGRSYLRKSLADLWPTPSRPKDRSAALTHQRQTLRAAVERILTGGPDDTRTNAMALRMTVSEDSPRRRYGTESSILRPTLEALAYTGLTILLPHQLNTPRDHTQTPRKGLTWALNPVPLTATAITAIHEERAWPTTWPVYTATTTTIGDGVKASRLHDTHPVETP